jgi:cell division septation protein DedD
VSRGWAVAAWLVFAAVAAGAAQETPDPLAAAERALAEGRAAEAREWLERWRAAAEDTASLETRARAWYLAARLSLDAAEAELYYLRVVTDASESPFADDALLRLAQYRLALGDPARAEEYLLRLRREYPTSELRAEALLWLSHAKRQAGDAEAACAAATQGMNEAARASPDLRAALTEALARCREPAAPRATGRGGYSVQVAALSTPEAAQALAARLRDAGFDAWVAAPGAGRLYRVRVGRGLSEADAQRLARQLTAAGYAAFVVAEGR